jgi:hypothetical protein
LYRTLALILACVALVFFALRLAQEPVRALQKPEVRPAPEAFEAASGTNEEGVKRPAADRGNTMIGDFQAPEHVPDYKILKESPDRRDGARAMRLLVDTREREEEYFVLITRDLKSRYSDYDAVTVEFTDTEDLLFYNNDSRTRELLAYYGGALIFNTYDGVRYLGYIYGAPNTEGYYVKAAD